MTGRWTMALVLPLLVFARASADPTPFEKPPKGFDNQFGYTWALRPLDVRAELALVKENQPTMLGAGGYALTLEKSTSGELVVTFAAARAADRPAVDYQVVAFDATPARHMLVSSTMVGSSANGAHLSMSRLILNKNDLPFDRVCHLGIEQLTPEGRRAIAERYAKLADKLGIDVLGPGKIGAPFDFSLSTLDGKRIRAQSLRGKVVMLVTWTSGCVDYVNRMQELKNIYRSHRGDGLEIIGVNLDRNEDEAKDGLKRLGLPFHVVWVPNDPRTQELWLNAGGSCARSLILDRQGILRADCQPDQWADQLRRVLQAEKK